MKKTFLSTGILCFLMTMVCAVVPGPDFSGTWALDKTKSENIPPQLSEGDISWVITATAKTLKKEVKGGRIAQIENYNLDGADVNEELPLGGFTAKAKRAAKIMGDILELKSVLTGEVNGAAFTATTTQHLELADGGKTLKVHQTRESTRGNLESKLVFTKK